jgi:hypothetical protein
MASSTTVALISSLYLRADATVWATDLKSYPVEVEENTGDILVNPYGI